MKQKTAMQDLIDVIQKAIDYDSESGFYNTDVLLIVKEMAEERLEKEKEQIMEAYDASQMEEWTDKDGLTWLSFYANANHYYNWKYKGQIISDEK